jgi:hypothetical protein
VSESVWKSLLRRSEPDGEELQGEATTGRARQMFWAARTISSMFGSISFFGNLCLYVLSLRSSSGKPRRSNRSTGLGFSSQRPTIPAESATAGSSHRFECCSSPCDPVKSWAASDTEWQVEVDIDLLLHSFRLSYGLPRSAVHASSGSYGAFEVSGTRKFPSTHGSRWRYGRTCTRFARFRWQRSKAAKTSWVE